ncbi:MAG: SPASM domain-containing protein [Bacteroidales bacterium]|nr:SPASM domain-containing protein [Bacteroidales bacterium]
MRIKVLKYQIKYFFKKLSISKLVNFIGLYISYIIAKISIRVVNRNMPYSISIEPTNYCNLSCPECPSGNKSLTRSRGYMSLNLFKQIIDKQYKKLINLVLYFQGEPYICKDFINMIEYAEQKNIYVITSTNGHFLDDETAKRTVVAGLDKLIISMDGTEQESYATYRKGGDLEKVKTGISNIVKWKQKLKSAKPFIELQFLVFRHNEEQIEEIRRFARVSCVDKLTLKNVQIYNLSEAEKLLPKDIKYSRYIKDVDGVYKLKRKQKNSCFRLWSSAVISWDGKVLPCCFDKDAKYCFGDLNSEEFEQIWHSERYKSFRKKVFHNRRQIDICRNCTE